MLSNELNSYVNALLNKSEEAYLMSIEIINKPTINYRTEGFCFFICNAWELLLKAYLINKAKDINVINARAEEYAQNNREIFDIVTARAVAPLKHLLEYGIPLVKKNGMFIAMKGNISNEIVNIDNYLQKLKIKENEIITFNLPIENSIRTLVSFVKLEKTDKKYPRRYKDIKNKEL